MSIIGFYSEAAKVEAIRKVQEQYPEDKLIELRGTNQLSQIELLAICLQKQGFNAEVGNVKPLLQSSNYYSSTDMHVDGIRFKDIADDDLFLLENKIKTSEYLSNPSNANKASKAFSEFFNITKTAYKNYEQIKNTQDKKMARILAYYIKNNKVPSTSYFSPLLTREAAIDIYDHCYNPYKKDSFVNEDKNSQFNLTKLRKEGKLTSAELLAACLQKQNINASTGRVDPLHDEPNKTYTGSTKITKEKTFFDLNGHTTVIYEFDGLYGLDEYLKKNKNLDKITKSKAYADALKLAKQIEYNTRFLPDDPQPPTQSMQKNPESPTTPPPSKTHVFKSNHNDNPPPPSPTKSLPKQKDNNKPTKEKTHQHQTLVKAVR